jgi:hypothetical protein
MSFNQFDKLIVDFSELSLIGILKTKLLEVLIDKIRRFIPLYEFKAILHKERIIHFIDITQCVLML